MTTKHTPGALATINLLNIKESAIISGIDIGRIERAQSILYVEGKLSKAMKTTFESDSRGHKVEQAKKDLINGCQHLRKEFYGVKNYSGFGDQGSDHPYGYGPRHGSIVFKIGLTESARNRELDPDEIEDALYYLSVLANYEAAIAKATGKDAAHE